VKETGQSSLQGVSEGQGKRHPKPRWCPTGLSKTQRRRLQKLRTKELEEEWEEKLCEEWFNEVRPVVNTMKTCAGEEVGVGRVQ
jgi:hypothetical protein